jgi:hypothetical protein
MNENTQTALIGAGISTALYTLLKTAKHYYENYYLKSTCHNSKELIISIEHIEPYQAKPDKLHSSTLLKDEPSKEIKEIPMLRYEISKESSTRSEYKEDIV